MPRTARVPQTDVPSYVDRIREHVERDEVGAARRLVAEALREGSAEPGLAHWAEVLAPARVLGFSPPTGSDVRVDVRWFDEHWQEYRGQWVAVLKGEMLAHAETLEELQDKLAQLRPLAASLVHFVE